MSAKKKIAAIAVAAALAATTAISATLAYFTDKTQPETNTFTVGNVNIALAEPNWDSNAEHNLMPGTTFEKDPTITVETGSEDCWVFMEVEMNKFNSWLRMVAQLNNTDNLPLFEFREGCEACAGEYDSCQGHLNAENLKTFFFNNDSRNAALAEWFAGIDTSNWIIMNGEEVWADIEKSWPDAQLAEGEKKPTTINPIIGYKTSLKAGNKVTLFKSVTMPGELTSEQLAYARFNTAEKPWTLKITAYAIQAKNVDTLDDAYKALFK